MDRVVDSIADREEIRHLMARYNIAGDRGCVDELVQVFAEDGVILFNGEATQGRAAIAARLQGGPPRPELTVSRHHLTTCPIEVEGEHARARTYFSVFTSIGPDHHGVYVDRFEKHAGGWLIARREVRIDWQSPHSLLPPLHVRGKAPG